MVIKPFSGGEYFIFFREHRDVFKVIMAPARGYSTAGVGGKALSNADNDDKGARTSHGAEHPPNCDLAFPATYRILLHSRTGKAKCSLTRNTHKVTQA